MGEDLSSRGRPEQAGEDQSSQGRPEQPGEDRRLRTWDSIHAKRQRATHICHLNRQSKRLSPTYLIVHWI